MEPSRLRWFGLPNLLSDSAQEEETTFLSCLLARLLESNPNHAKRKSRTENPMRDLFDKDTRFFGLPEKPANDIAYSTSQRMVNYDCPPCFLSHSFPSL